MKKRVLLVGWDSADWKIIKALQERGAMPAVSRLMQDGVHGNLRTLEPQLSPMLWTSIASGKMAYHHGVKGFTEVDPVTGQVVPVSAASRQCKTVWEMLNQHDLKTHLVGWFATQGERDLNGKMVSNMFPHLKGESAETAPQDWKAPSPGTYYPKSLAETMNELRVSPHEIDGEIIQPFIPHGAEIDQDKDKRLFQLVEHMAESYSIHSAATHLMETDPDWDFMAVYYRAIDEISHHFMPYHPPRLEGVPEEDFRHYQNVVNSTYMAHDLMLKRLMELAGEDTLVLLVSDHGFHSDHLRPRFTPRVPAGITVWHREQGILVAKGAGIKQENPDLYGANLLDLTPTILHYFGLPVGQDMEGRVLTEIFEHDRPVEKIPSWEDPEGSDPSQKSSSHLSSADSAALLEQFVALGYIDEVSSDTTEAARGTIRENDWNLARAYLYTGKFQEALPLLENCYDAIPGRIDYAQLLARAQYYLGLLAEAEETLRPCLEHMSQSFTALLLKATILLDKDQREEALSVLETIEQVAPQHPKALEILCRVKTRYQLWEEAQKHAQELLSQDPDNVQAHLTLSRYHNYQQEYEAASDLALRATQLEFSNPAVHLVLGRALEQLGDLTEAAHAFRNSLKLDLNNPAATKALSRVLDKLGLSQEAIQCRSNGMRIIVERQDADQKRLQSVRDGVLKRAKIRHQERQKREVEKKTLEAGGSGYEFTIVSGLPRSGTSLMMQMLRSAGLDLMHDEKRLSDEDNPEGYWEWAEIMGLRKNPTLIEQAEGKVTKVISALLPALPHRHRYRVIYMRRPVEQVVRSQWKMLERRGTSPKSEFTHLVNTQEGFQDQLLPKLQQQHNMDILEIDYPTLVTSPHNQLADLSSFLNLSKKQKAALTAPIRETLHRNK